MLETSLVLLIAVVVLALTFDLINGFHDSANAIATSVLTRALSMRNAVLLAAAQNFIGAMMWEGVAKTMGEGIVIPDMVKGIDGQTLVVAAVAAAIIWNLVTWWFGLPSSSSHAAIGGLIGAGIAAGGVKVLTLHDPNGIPKILKALLFSPIVGFIAGLILMAVVMNAFARKPPSKLNRVFKILQVISANFVAFSHGSNDAQKSMGIITMALYVAHRQDTLHVATWVKLSCAAAMAIGTAMGGWRIIKTVGKKVIGMQPVHGFAAETAASFIILGATLMHVPVSTTHVISSSIMGVGAARRLSAVRWGVVGKILGAWLLTLPVSGLLGAGCYMGLRLVFR